MRASIACLVAAALAASTLPGRAQEGEPVDPGAAAFGAVLGGVIGGVVGAGLSRKRHDGDRVLVPGDGPKPGGARGGAERIKGQGHPGGEGARAGQGAQHGPAGGQVRRKREGAGAQ